MNHLGQAIHVLDQKRATLALDKADARQAIELSGHGLTVRADAACDLHMGRRRNDRARLCLRAVRGSRAATSSAWMRLLTAKRAELIDAVR